MRDRVVAILPVGTDAVAVGLESKTLLLYRGAEPPLKLLDGASASDSPAAFSPDGSLVAQVDQGGIGLYSTLDGQQLSTLPLVDPTCGDTLEFAPDNQHLLLLGGSATCAIDLNGAVVARVAQMFSEVGFQAGQLVAQTAPLAFSAFDGAGQALPPTVLAINPDDVRTCALSPAGDRVAIQTDGDLDFGYRLYDRKSGAIVADLQQEPRYVDRPLFSPDGSFVLLGGHVLRSADGSVVSAMQRGVDYPVGLSVDGRRLGMQIDDGPREPHFMLLDLASNKPVRAFGTHNNSLIGISVSPDGTRFATTTGYLMMIWNIDAEFSASSPAWVARTGLDMYSQFSPDGSILAVSGDGRALFSADGSSMFRVLPPPSVSTCGWAHFAFSPDGRWVAGGFYGFFVDVYDTMTHELVTRLPSSSCNSTASFSPDGALLVTGALETYRTTDWTRVSPENIVPVQGTFEDNEAMNGATFAPDGTNLVVSRCTLDSLSINGSRHCQNWLSTADGVARTTLPVSGPRPNFSPDGGNIVAGADLLQLSSGAVASLGPDITSAAFAPNRDIIAGTKDGAVVRFCLKQ
jgi:WD40 repeat protein